MCYLFGEIARNQNPCVKFDVQTQLNLLFTDEIY